jgi:hypothetical protein
MYPEFNTDAEGFAFVLSEGLDRFALDETIPLREVLRSALEYARERCLVGDRKLPGADIPEGSVVMVRIGERSIEWLRLGDCEIYYAPENFFSIDLRHGEICAASEVEIRQRRDDYGLRTIGLDRCVDIIRRERELKNVEGGYWVAGPDPDLAEYAAVGELPRTPGSSIYLWSDGFGILFGRFGHAHSELETESTQRLASKVRETELEDFDRVKYFRVKQYDDLSVVRIYI